MATNKSESTEKREVFRIPLPPELSIAPRFSVPVSASFIAHIYDATELKNRRIADTPGGAVYQEEAVQGFVIAVRHKTTEHPPRSYDLRNHNFHHNFHRTLLDVKLALEGLAANLAPKTKTSRVQEDED